METIGEILKKQRLERDMSLEQVAETTKISKSVIQAIEVDDFSSFSADVYTIGFIVNLCDCYGMDSGEITNLWKNRNTNQETSSEDIQEEAEAEVDDDMRIPDDNKKKLIIVGSILLFLVILGLITILLVSGDTTINNTNINNELEKTTVYRLNGEKELFDLVARDQIKIYYDSTYYNFKLNVINDEKISFSIENANFQLGMDETLPVDLDKDNSPDIEMHLRNISGEMARLFIQKESTGSKKVDYQQLWDNEKNVYVGKEFVLIEKQDKVPVELFVRAQQFPSHIQYIVDGKQTKSTTLKAGEGEFIMAEESIEIIIGNYQSVQFFINNIPINLTMEHTKYSVTKIIKWVKYPYNDTKFDLVIKDYVN